MVRKRSLGLVLSSQDFEALDTAVASLLKTLGDVSSQAEVQLVSTARHEDSGHRIYVRKITTPQISDKMVVKLGTLILPNTVNVKIFEI